MSSASCTFAPKRSSNKDLKMLSRMTKGQEFKRANIQGPGIESVVTNSAYIAASLERAQCETREGVEKLFEDEIKGKSRSQEVRGYEQHMLEENENKGGLANRQVRIKWTAMQ